MQRNRSLSKRLLSLLLSMILVGALVLSFGLSVSAASTVKVGFPLPATKVYSANVLHKYFGGAKHEIYLYTYGPLKSKKEVNTCIADIGGAAEGTPIYAVAAGSVISNAYTSRGGYMMVIRHADQSYSYYGHMKKKGLVAVKKTVKAGQLIGYVGKTGEAAGPHLHFEWSDHDPYCMYYSMGLLKTGKNSGASAYPHTHGLSISGNKLLPLTAGKSSTVSVTTSPKGMVPTWKSSNTAVAKVDKNGTITGVKMGTAKITATIQNGKAKAASLTINVVVAGLPSIFTTKPATAVTPTPTAAPAKVTTTPTPAPVHSTGSWTGYVLGTDGALALNQTASTAKPLKTIPEGSAVTVYPNKTSGKWYYVKYGSTYGYAYSTYVVKGKPATRTGVVKGTGSALNIRTGTATSSKIRGTVKEGTTVTVFTGRTSGNWYWIYVNGVAGYVSKTYIKLS